MKNFFGEAEIVRVLHGFNPWWSGKTCRSPEFNRLAFGACQNILKNRQIKRAVLLSGPRRVGKTTVLQQIAASLIDEGGDPASILYLSLDHPLLKLQPLNGILQIYHETIFPEDKSITLLLDEIQYSREWETEIKLLIDHKPNYRILATGSASVVHRERLAESGVGRWITVPIPTLSFYEFVHLRGEQPPSISSEMRVVDTFKLSGSELAGLAVRMRSLMPLFQRYLLVGGFPETALQEDVDLCQRLLREDVVERVLKRDMTALFGVRNITDLEKLFIYLCLHTGGILPHSTCARELETSAITVSNHLLLLEQANLIYRLPPASLGGKRVLKAKNKYYLIDAALRNAVLLRGNEILMDPDQMGIIVETTILRHLYAYYYRDTPEIVYWRDSTTGKEVDFIVRSPAYVLPFEVKYKNKATLDSDSGLVTFCRSENPQLAYLITKDDNDFRTSSILDKTKILKIPAHIFCYLIGQAERLLWK